MPVVALALLAAAWGSSFGGVVMALVAAALAAAVLCAVHHAEVVAHRVGEPFGTLVLAVAVTAIEVALILSMMLAGGNGAATIARDTVFAAIMIVCSGAIGLCILAGGLRHRVLAFRVEGAGGALAVLAALSVLTLVLPTYTTTTPGPEFSPSQLAFAGVASLVLYLVFVFVQTVRHRDYFLPDASADDTHAEPPTTRVALAALGLLLLSLVAIIGLSKLLSPRIEQLIAAANAPPAVAGIVIAALVLMPETWAAIRAAMSNKLQTSLNLTLGSALASIGLTIPAVAALSVFGGFHVALGLAPKEIAMLFLTLLVGAITYGYGRVTVLQGAVHLVIFAAFLFLSVVP